MASTGHNQLVRFRVNEALAASAERHARENGLSLSEFIRSTIRREIGE